MRSNAMKILNSVKSPGSLGLALLLFNYACSDQQLSEANQSPETGQNEKCLEVGQWTLCTCLDGFEGSRQCLPDGTFSSCWCDPETSLGIDLVGGSASGGVGGANVSGGTGGTIDSGGVSGNPDTQDVTGGISAGFDGGASIIDGAVAGTGGNIAGNGGTGGDAPPVEPPAPDCDNILPLPRPNFNQLSHVPGSEDFTFDNQGYLLGVNLTTNELFRVPYSGSPEVLARNVGTSVGSWGGMPITVRGIRYLPDGKNIVYADRGTGSLVKMNMTDYSKQTLISGLVEPNGIVVDMQGFVYATEMGGRVVRVDPVSGASSVLFSEGVSLDGIAFSLDYKTLYIDSEMGYVSYMPIHDDGTAGDWTLMTQVMGPTGFAILDGLTTDECGNIYAVQMNGIITRISKDGAQETVVTLFNSDGTGGGFPGMLTINAINFGTGINGWKADALYVISMMGSVYEIEVGVKGIPQAHIQ